MHGHVGQHRIDWTEGAGPLPLGEDPAERGEHRAHQGERAGIEVRRTLGNLAEHQRREVRPLIGQLDERGDEGGQLVGRRARLVGDCGNGLAGIAEHLAHHFAVQRELVGEVVVDHRLVDAGEAGDVVDDDAVEAAA